MLRLLMIVLMCPTVLLAKGERAGDFDYYVMALSWSPNFCALEGRAKDNPQCDESFGWVLHGLWPQYEDGWPSYCPTVERNPSRSMTAGQSPLFGSSGSAWHQWNKHGTCTGLSATEYYDLSQDAYDSVVRPEVFRKLPRAVEIPAGLVEEAFLKDNPGLTAKGVTVTCKRDMIQEVRICLDTDLNPRDCGRDVRRDCSLNDAEFLPMQ